MRDTFFYLSAYFKSKTGLLTFAVLFALMFLPRAWPQKMMGWLSALNPHKVLTFSLMTGFLLRLLWIGLAPTLPYSDWGHPDMDESDIIHLQAISASQGQELTNEDGTPSGRRPVGYIFFIALLYRVFGVHPWMVMGLQLLLSTFVIYQVFRLVRFLGVPWITHLVTFLWAVYPPAVISSGIVLDEHLFIPLWFWSLEILLRNAGALSWKKAAGLGLLWGVSTVVRTQSIMMPVLAAFWGLCYFRGKISWLMKCALMMALLLAVNLPWAARNYRVWGIPIYYTATGGFVYSMLNPYSRGDITRVPEKGERYYSEEFHHVKNEAEAHVIGWAMAKKWVLENPVDFLVLMTQKTLWLMSPDNFEWAVNLHAPLNQRTGRIPPAGAVRALTFLERLFHNVFLYGFLFLFFSGFLTGARGLFKNREFIFFFLLIAAWIGLHAILNPFAKYRFPMDPFFFAVTLYFFHKTFSRKPDKGAPAA